MKFGCSVDIFLNSANLICRSTDISKCFRESLRLRDNESKLNLDIDPQLNGSVIKCLRVVSTTCLLYNTSASLTLLYLALAIKSEISYTATAEICSYARKHFRSPYIVEFGTHADTIACTPPDTIKPGDILRKPSGALEGRNGKNV